MSGKIYLYILVCAAVSFLIRELPLTLIRKENGGKATGKAEGEATASAMPETVKEAA